MEEALRQDIREALHQAVDALAQAKAEHDVLEKLYNPHVDFEGVYAQADAVAGELLAIR